MTTNGTQDPGLFPSSLISPAVLSALPSNYTCRPLRSSDYDAGFLDVLRVLTTVGDISRAQWDERYGWMQQREGEYYILVITDGEERVVGTGALVVERKLYVHSIHLSNPLPKPLSPTLFRPTPKTTCISRFRGVDCRSRSYHGSPPC